MYSSKLVAAIKANGKVLREFKDEVYVPFGSEYSVLLKNLNTVRALVNISIDGQDVVDGGLVINPNSEIELERFVKDLNKGNRFKFIERTGGIEKHRGVKLEDGLVRIEFKYEKRLPQYDWNEINKWKIGTPTPGVYYNTPLWNSTPVVGSPLRGAYATSVSTTGASPGPQFMNCSATYSNSMPTMDSCDVSVNNIGITAPGSVSEQKFQEASWFPTETETFVMVLKLLGETEQGKQVQKPVTVKAKPKCSMCGKLNKAAAKFCGECGTGLEIV